MLDQTNSVQLTPQQQKMQEVYLELGLKAFRENDALAAHILHLMKERPDWSGTHIATLANQQIVTKQVRDGMQVYPGVTVANQSIANSTAQMNIDGTMSRGPIDRNAPTNAVSIDGSQARPGFLRHNAAPTG